VGINHHTAAVTARTHRLITIPNHAFAEVGTRFDVPESTLALQSGLEMERLQSLARTDHIGAWLDSNEHTAGYKLFKH